MKKKKGVSAEGYKLLSGFATVRQMLRADTYAEVLEKPLAHWVLPSDRRLPLVLLGRTVGQLLATSFEELASTPGIGHKKINSLVQLLNRVAEDGTAEGSFDAARGSPGDDLCKTYGNESLEPSMVSEARWEKWCDTVRRHGLVHEKLGYLAPTLRALPTVVWHTPLSFYLDRRLAEIRQLKTHGEKRLRGVFEVFHGVHNTLAGSHDGGHLSIRVAPKFIEPIAHWIADLIDGGKTIARGEVRQRLVQPLVQQIKYDLGDAVYDLALGRLGIDGRPRSVRQQSRRMGVTRARVYQLLEDCHKMISVRWPQGKSRLAALTEHLAAVDRGGTSHKLALATVDLFYPEKAAEG